MDEDDTLGVAIELYNLIVTGDCSIPELEKSLEGTDTKSILLEKIDDQNLVTFSCEKNQLFLVEYFIKVCKLDVDARYNFPYFSDSCSMLCWACRNLKYDLVNLLLHLGADINFRGSFGKQPLHYLCSLKVDSKETELSITRLVRHLVNQGANVNDKTNSGATPLMFASQRFHSVEVCKELISHEAEINAVDNSGNSALHYFFSSYAGCGNRQLLDVLLELGADITKENNNGETPPDILIKQWCADYIELRRFLLDDDFLRSVQNNITLDWKYHMMEIYGAMSALDTDGVSNSVCFWTESSTFLSGNPDMECCRITKSLGNTTIFPNIEEYTNSEEFNFNDRSECLKQAIIKSYRHLGFDHHLTLILCLALLDFYRIHYRTIERMTFFKNMLDFILKDEKYQAIMHVQSSSPEDLLLPFPRHWFAILEQFTYFETEYTQKLLTVLFYFLENNIHNAPLDSRYAYTIIEFIRHFSDAEDEIPNEVSRLLQKFIELDVTFACKTSNVDLLYVVCTSSKKPRSAILRVLLHNGMSANGVDEYGNTALHKYLLHRSRTISDDEDDDATVVELLRNHTHLDIANKWGVTPLRLLAKKYTVYPLTHTTLQCLATRVIRKYKLNFVGFIPKSLEPFVELHKPVLY